VRRDSAVVALRVAGAGRDAAGADTTLRVRILERYVQVAVTSGRVCALTVQGFVYCWGGTVSAADLVPTLLTSAAGQQGVRFLRLVAGESHFCGEGVAADGSWFCWGRNDAGQLTDASPNLDQRFPVPMALGRLNPTGLSVSTAGSCAVGPSGGRPIDDAPGENEMSGAGSTAGGRRTGGATRPRAAPRRCRPPGRPRAASSPPATGTWPWPWRVGGGAASTTRSGGSQASERRSLEFVVCWSAFPGAGLSGTPLPSEIVLTESQPGGAAYTLRDVVVGTDAACVLRVDAVLCWGGRFGTAPRPVLTGIRAGSLALMGGSTVCGLRAADGTLACDYEPGLRPFTLGGPGPSLAAFAVSGSYDLFRTGCGVRPGDGAVLCWGNNQAGQLGTGTRSFTERTDARPARILEPPR
jgi:hypothetical protein